MSAVLLQAALARKPLIAPRPAARGRRQPPAPSPAPQTPPPGSPPRGPVTPRRCPSGRGGSGGWDGTGWERARGRPSPRAPLKAALAGHRHNSRFSRRRLRSPCPPASSPRPGGCARPRAHGCGWPCPAAPAEASPPSLAARCFPLAAPPPPCGPRPPPSWRNAASPSPAGEAPASALLPPAGLGSHPAAAPRRSERRRGAIPPRPASYRSLTRPARRAGGLGTALFFCF